MILLDAEWQRLLPRVWLLALSLLQPLLSAAAVATDEVADYQWSLPPGFPPPLVPADNPMSAAKVALGQLLFADVRLSVNGTVACQTCHQPELEFTDGLPRPTGALGEVLPFNTPTLWNAAYSASFSWIDKGFQSLAEQHLGPLTNHSPVELGTTPEVLATLSQDPPMAQALRAAFPARSELSLESVSQALASYVRTLIRGGTAFDEYLFEDRANALGDAARAGLALFSSERLGCSGCHRGFLLSGPTRSARARFSPTFYRTGVAAASSGAAAERAFRAPSLRFVSTTAPYMHNGSMASLSEVLDFYTAGGGEDAERLQPFVLSAAERRELLAFLQGL